MRVRGPTRRVPWLVCLGFALVLAACAPSPWPAELDEAETAWRAHEVDDYAIEVSHMRSTWHFQTHSITVRDGTVADASATCVTAPVEGALEGSCEVESFDPDAYTVPGLFATARALAEAQPAPALAIVFDDTYGFPVRIDFDIPQMVDEDQLWRVESFEVLP